MILALYHASSADATENCENVFVEEKPYLKSVSTPHETRESAYRSEMCFSLDNFNERLKNNGYPTFEEDLSFKIIKGESGRCKTLVISDSRTSAFVDGRRVREIFSLKSSSFDVLVEDGITFDVYGYGHGVGMSQNGAVILAENGKTYREILETYYLFSDISNIVYKS
ncbi:MAG: SpoIID/LytB domain-containing protein [Clostridia bacterium]|nr:SpoIID/LytB domain-containing protein [Clostridia bacterium]